MKLSPSLCAALIAAAPAAATTPQAAFESLLAADRSASSTAAETDVVTGISAMLADDAIMPAPTGVVVRGKDAVVAALRANPDNATSTVEWSPLSGGLSGDGQQGYTFGHMVVHRPGKPDLPLKYLAYWAKRGDEWRVVAYKRSRRPEGAAPVQTIAAVLPATLSSTAAPPDDSLRQAESAFSDEAQKIGLRAAFAKYGRPVSINLGSGPGFTVGATAIAQDVAGPESTSELNWSSDGVIVAGSGDLGVSYGMIRRNGPTPEGQPAAFPFFTIWQRAGASDPWRYVAE